MRKKSVVLLSGGLDSAANLAICRDRDNPVLALTIRYGQRAAEKEVEAARSLSAHYDVPHEVVDLPWLGRLGGSSLTQAHSRVPELKADQLEHPEITRESARSVWVPNRNGVLINVAAAYADRHGAEAVVVGFNREEAVTFADNSAEFLDLSTRALSLSTSNSVKLLCYTTDLDKKQIVGQLRKSSANFPFEKLWSCYHGEPNPCGKCESCQRLARAIGA